MFRRKSRTTHTTAYTGVNQPAPANNQPNSSAVAAALTIGNSRKATTKPVTSLSQKTTSKTPQPKITPTNTYGGSLFKRGSRASIGSVPSNVQPAPAPALGPPTSHTHPFRRFSSGSTITNTSAISPTKVHDIDDSFTDSYIDDITDETTRVYLKNQQNLKDLKLEHKPAKSVPKKSPNTPKMVKKYIPTPTGIKIIEVPQETFDKEVARCNSMRGAGINSRSSSLRNIANPVKPILRSSSLNNVTPRKSPVATRRIASSAISPVSHNLEPMKEVVELEDKLGKSDEILEQHRKLELLQKQIDEEKKLAHELEVKKQEYEKLKASRVQREKSLNEAIERDSNLEESTTIISVEENNGVAHTIEKHEEQIADLIEKPELSIVDTLSDDDEDTIPPPVSESKDSKNYPSLDPGVNELGIISQYGNFRSTELLNLEDGIEKPKEYETQDNNVPAAFPTELPNVDATTDAIHAPSRQGNHSSKSSVYSNESPVRKPMKSAMKNSTSSLPLQPATAAGAGTKSQPQATPVTRKPSTKPNPAQQAYLSLTTAENTRLNSKISNTELNGSSAYPPFHNANQISPTPQQKRLSHQSMRKSPPPPHQIRSLRPNSMPMEPPGMTSRQFRHTPVSNAGHTVVQPLAPHPMSVPGYTSPSKARAQELYAKAQARPKSVFKPTTQETTVAKQEKVKNVEKKKTQRMTLRDPMPPSATQSHGSKPINSSTDTTPTSDSSRRRKFKSRLLDSDDEDGPVGHIGGFSSRFNDSDDAVHVPHQLTEVKDVEFIPTKEKKKFGKLRKLFGTKHGS